jgi:hypothetical protein
VDTCSREDLIDEIQALECDLDYCLELMVKVASGNQTTDEMGKWVSLNYPKFRERLPERLRELPPTRT